MNYTNEPNRYGQKYAQPAWQPNWEYHNGNWHSTTDFVPTRRKKPARRARKAVAALAMLLACALCGFGGAYAALRLNDGQGAAVVYRVPEISTTARGPLENGLSVAEAAALAAPSVVSIRTEVTGTVFGRPVVEQGAGSGVILTQDGVIITNNHVVNGAQRVLVSLADGSEHMAAVLGADAANDIAVLKIEADGLQPAMLSNSDNLQVGDAVLAIGNSLGTLSNTVTDGIISALGREIDIDGYSMNLLQMSAAVSPGNSGGGLFNTNGELVGVVNAKSAGANAEGLGFAIPVNTAMAVAEQIMLSK